MFTLPWTQDAFHNEITNNLFAKYIIMICGKRVIGYVGMWTLLELVVPYVDQEVLTE